MKRKILSAVLGLAIMVGVAGCGNSQGESIIIEAKEAETVAEQQSTLEVSEAQVESKWKVDKKIKFNLPVNFCGFYNSDIGLTVGIGGDIHYTADKGENWGGSVNESACIFCLDFLNENIVYAAGDAGNVIKSIDGGKCFTPVGYFTEKKRYKCVMLNFADENYGLIASTDQIGITNDGGVTWSKLRIEGKPISLLMVSAKEFYIINNEFNLLKTVDAGKSWEITSLNLPHGSDYLNSICSMAIVMEDAQTITVYCIQKSEKNTLKSYTTKDVCATWSENTMPEFEGAAEIYPSKNGEVINLYTISETTITTLVKQ